MMSSIVAVCSNASWVRHPLHGYSLTTHRLYKLFYMLYRRKLADPVTQVEYMRPVSKGFEDKLDAIGQRLPASHANFYIGNHVVLLPTFGGASDAQAAEVLQRCFPDRQIVGLDSRDLVWGLGAWHCLTQQVPAVG